MDTTINTTIAVTKTLNFFHWHSLFGCQYRVSADIFSSRAQKKVRKFLIFLDFSFSLLSSKYWKLR